MDIKENRLERKNFLLVTKDIMPGYELVYKPQLPLIPLWSKRMNDNDREINRGIVFRNNKDIPVNTILRCTLVFPPNNIQIKPLGKVVWVEEKNGNCDTGIEFINIGEEIPDQITAFIKGELAKREDN